MGIKERNAPDSTVSGVDKQSDVGFWFGALTLPLLLASKKTFI